MCGRSRLESERAGNKGRRDPTKFLSSRFFSIQSPFYIPAFLFDFCAFSLNSGGSSSTEEEPRVWDTSWLSFWFHRDAMWTTKSDTQTLYALRGGEGGVTLAFWVPFFPWIDRQISQNILGNLYLCAQLCWLGLIGAHLAVLSVFVYLYFCPWLRWRWLLVSLLGHSLQKERLRERRGW